MRGFFLRLFFSDNRPDITKSRILQPTQFVGKGKIKIQGAILGCWPSPGLLDGYGYIEARASEALVEIKSSTILNNNFVVIADRSEISIGERCLIGPNFFVTDSDFHGLKLEDRCNGNYYCARVDIEDDVFIGNNVRVLKGVRIGRGSVIGSGSTVVNDVEPMSIYAGIPARKIKEI
ncbi:acyltransferase [Sansalvadorimonas verongulae]|nr:acyltransferase [Sansalvadorimonas verongulae]